jgi:hypothetical protein
MLTLIILSLLDREPTTSSNEEATHLSSRFHPPTCSMAASENLLVNIARDGRVIVYAARRDGVARLFVRRLGDGEATMLEGTDGAHSPFFSPDGKWIAFIADSKLKKVSVNGGPVFEVCPWVRTAVACGWMTVRFW